MTLDSARDPDHDRLVDPVPPDVEIEFAILELLGDQGIDSAVRRFPRWWF
jgi:hypothetical protein